MDHNRVTSFILKYKLPEEAISEIEEIFNNGLLNLAASIYKEQKNTIPQVEQRKSKTKCISITKSGRQCRHFANENSQFCNLHFQKAEEQHFCCNGLTNGLPCKLSAKLMPSGSSNYYCAKHANNWKLFEGMKEKEEEDKEIKKAENKIKKQEIKKEEIKKEKIKKVVEPVRGKCNGLMDGEPCFVLGEKQEGSKFYYCKNHKSEWKIYENVKENIFEEDEEDDVIPEPKKVEYLEEDEEDIKKSEVSGYETDESTKNLFNDSDEEDNVLKTPEVVKKIETPKAPKKIPKRAKIRNIK